MEDQNESGNIMSDEEYSFEDDGGWDNVEQFSANGWEDTRQGTQENEGDSDEGWENVSECNHDGGEVADDASPANDQPANELSSMPHLNEDWDSINAALNKQAEEEGTKKKSNKVKRLTKAEKNQRTTMRLAHIVCLMAREAEVNRSINDVSLQALLRSIAPADLEAIFKKDKFRDVAFLVQNLMQWFRHEFRRLPYTSSKHAAFNITVGSLMNVFFQREGHEHEMVCLFAALCRSWNINTRYTCSLDTPLVLKRHEAFDPHFGVDHSDDEEESSHPTRLHSSLRAWCEVFTSKEWIHVDVIRNLLNQPLEVERLRGRGSIMPHIVSFEASGRMIDVTRHFASDWARTQVAQCNPVWWSKLLQVGKYADDPVDVDEKLPMPTSVAGFKNHSQYCLEQHLGLYEWIHPRKPVGLFKGLPVFDRQSVQALHSAHRWLRQGRVVLASERDNPCKKVPKRKPPVRPTENFANPTPFSVATAVASADESTISLYGQWQTEAFVAPQIVDGVIPKNEHGNIEIWSDACLPIGSAHIRLPRAKQVATKLGIDFAPALVGWESKAGRSVPIFDGIVVCDHFVDMIQDAHSELEHSTVEKALAQKKKEIAKRWGLFVKKLLLRKRLRDEYG
ncbi:unnamed protein product [Aphanomyces euteiches]